MIVVEICQSGVIIGDLFGEKLRLGGKAAMVEWRLEIGDWRRWEEIERLFIVKCVNNEIYYFLITDQVR